MIYGKNTTVSVKIQWRISRLLKTSSHVTRRTYILTFALLSGYTSYFFGYKIVWTWNAFYSVKVWTVTVEWALVTGTIH